jgi:hypothetical protein
MKNDIENKINVVFETVEARITSKIRVFIQSKNNDVTLNQPVYAINWLDTRMLWIYELYNWLAGPAVKKINGKPFFKGRVSKVLYGQEEYRRDVLLIVYYPSASAFKHMLENGFFQIVSLLRILAVKEFTFGFSRRVDDAAVDTVTADSQEPFPTDKVYAIHHYRAEQDITKALAEVIDRQGVNIYFSSRMSAYLFSGDLQGPAKQVPCLMDGVVLLQADSQLQLEDAVRQEKYQALIRQTDSSFISGLNRVL